MNERQFTSMLILAVVAGFVGGLLASFVFGSGPVMAQPVQERAKVIAAEAFQVVDKDGKPRAHFGTRSDGKTSLVIGYEEKSSRVALSTLPDGSAALAIVGPDGKSVSLSWDAGGKMGLVLFDRSVKMRVEILTEADGTPSLLLHDKTGRVVWKAP